MAPQQIGQFTIVAELAKTDGGAVYKATDPKGRIVALRTLRLDAPGAAEIVPRFKAAAKAASTLSSPNIASIFGGGEGAGVFFIAVEFVEGVKLSSNLAKGEAASMSEVLDLSRQVCYALEHAHAKGICHPELKPTNIIMEWDGTAKIMDFGVPRTHPADEITEVTYYLSPEEIAGGTPTARSNQFTWAAIAYHMATGKKPFDAEDAATLRRKIAEEQPVPAHEVNPKLSPRVSEILSKAMAKAPGERYASAAEFLTALESYKRGDTAVPTPAAAPAKPRAVAAPTPKPAAAATPAPVVTPRPTPAPTTPPAGAAKPQPAPAPATPAPQTTERPPVPVQQPAAAPKPAGAKPAAPSRNLLYAMAGVIVLLIIVVGVLWMRSRPAEPAPVARQPVASQPSFSPENSFTVDTSSANQPAGANARGSKSKQKAPAAPAEVPVATGGISIDSSPQGAEVQIDGRHESNWTTPFTAAGLSVGPHTVVFSKPGHASITRSVNVAGGQNTIAAVQLAELAATFAVSSDPAGASVLLDGKDTGKVTPAQLVVAKGSHTVTVRKAGYLEASTTQEAAAGQSLQFAPALKQTGSTDNIKTVGKLGGMFGGAPADSGRVSVRSNPKGAQVSVNGQPIKKTTPVDFYLPPGSYEIVLTMDGYKPIKKIVDVQKGGKLTVDETLSH